MLTFAIEFIDDCWDEIFRIRAKNWDEEKRFCPMLERYRAYEECGWFLQFTARDADNILRGFVGMYLTPSMHTQELMAQEDYWFIEKEHRKNNAFNLFYDFVETELRRRGVAEINLSVKDEKMKKKLEFIGYSCAYYQYSKHLIGADSSMTKNEVNSLMEQSNEKQSPGPA